MARVYVSIGSNVEPERNVRSGMEALRQRWGDVAFSPVYRSAAVGFQGDPFYNAVAGFDTEEPPDEVQAALHAIEDAHGRRRDGVKFSSRKLDLDLLTWGELVIDREGLRLPRDEILTMDFVLRPLADLAPEDVHPVELRTYRDLWRHFDGERSIHDPPVEL